MRAARFLTLLTLLFAASLLLVACGADDGGGSADEDEIVTVIETSAVSTDPADCAALLTQAFMEQTGFETGDAAVTACEQDAADTSDDPDSVEVAEVAVDGSTATANVTFVGGVFDGSVLTISLVKEGEQWKLDSIDDIPELNREALVQSFTDEITAAGDVPPEIADCIVQAFTDASDEDLKAAILSGDGEQVTALFAPCIPSG